MRILRSKITVPQIPSDSIPRPRLTADLDAGRSLAFVAPAGFGKTTYAMQELRSSGQPIAWLSLQPEDREPTRFCTLVWESISAAIPQFAASGINLEPENLESPESLAEALCYFAQEAATTPSWICFDNLESVQSEKAISRAVNQLLTHGSSRLRIVLTTRESEGLGLSLLEGRGLVRIVRQSELVFSRRDISALMTIRGRPEIGHAVETAWSRTQGWPVAVGMWARRPRTEDHEAGGTGMTPDAFSSFVDEVLLQGLEPEFRDFLCRTSFFDVLDASASEAVGFTPEQTRTHLRALASSALPLFKSRQDEFQVHAALRDALSRGFRASSSRGEFQEAVERAARHLEEGPRLESAIDLLIAHGLFPQMLETVGRQSRRLLTCQHRSDEWIAAVPAEYQHHSIYIRWKGMHLHRFGDQEQASAFLGARIGTVENSWERFHVWVLYNFALLHAGRAQSARQLAEEGEAWKVACPDVANDAAWLVANGHVRELQIAQAVELMEPILDGAVDRLTFHSWVLSWRGQLGQDVVADLLRISHDAGSETEVPSALIPGMLAAELLLGSGRLREALAVATANIQRGAEAKIPRGSDENDTRLTEGVSRWRLGEEEESISILEDLVPHCAAYGRVGEIRGRIALEFLRLQSRVGSPSDRALSQPDTALDELDTMGLPGELRLQQLCLRALRNREDAATVTECGAEILSVAEKAGMVPWIATGSFLLSWGRFHQRQFEEADAALEVGLASLEACGWRSYPMARKDLTAYVFVRAVESQQRVDLARELVTGEEHIPLEGAFRRALSTEDLGADTVERLLGEARRMRARGLTSFVPDSDELRKIRTAYAEWSREAPLPPLRIRMLGRFSVDGADGSRGFRRTASKTILQMLLLARGSAIHEEQLMGRCWPETDLDKGRRNLQTTINDLRKDLDPLYAPRGNSYVVYGDGSYSLSLPNGSSVDLYEFSEAVSRFRKNEDPSDSEIEEVIRHLNFGRFELLPEARYESFCELERNRVRSVLETGTLAAVTALENGERRREAVDLLRSVLDEDPLWQDGVEALMNVLRVEGRNIAAIRAFRSYEKLLLEESGLVPDDRLLALLPLEGKAG